MKKLGKILAVVLTFVLLLGAVAIVSAAEETTNADSTSNLGVKANLSLYSTFTYNIYVPTDAGVTGVTIDGETAEIYTTYSDGTDTYNVYRKEGIDPTKAGESFAVVFTLSDGTTKTLELSVLSYIKTALNSDAINKASKNLVLSVLKYVHSSYVYFDPTGAESYSAVKELYDAHVAADTLYAPVYNGESMEDVKEWISSACLNLNENPAFRFYVKDENVEATATYVFNGKTVTKTFNKDNFSYEEGKGEYYFEVALRAYEFAQVITVEAGGETGTYSLGAYYNSNEVQGNAVLQTLVKSLNTYSKGAEVYKNVNNKNLSDDVKLEYEKVLLDVALPAKVTEAGSFELPGAGAISDTTITWAIAENDNYATISNGSFEVLELPEKDIEITLTATIKYGDVTETKELSVTVKAKEPTTVDSWVLVTDASKLSEGAQIVIVAKDSAVALSTTQNSNNRGQASVTKSGNTVTFGSDVQVITLEVGMVDDTWAFNTGSGYLYAASSGSNHLKTQATNNANGSWKIEIAADGVATIKAQGTYTRNWLRYNNALTNGQLFSCYGSGQQDVCIYVKESKPIYNADKVAATKGELNIKTEFDANGTIALPSNGTQFADVEISWTKDGVAYTDSTLEIVQTEAAQTIVLVATIKCGRATENKEFTVTVTPGITAADKVAYEQGNISAPATEISDGEEITLNTIGSKYNDVTIAWALSENANGYAAIVDGKLVVVNAPEEDTEITLTATISHEGTDSKKADFTVTVKKKAAAWVLVTDASQLTAGAKIVIVAKDYAYAIGTNQKSNNRGQASVTKNDDGTVVTFGGDVQVITLEAGTVNGTYAFNVGSGYLYAASSGDNYLRTQATNDANGSWIITIADGVATIKAQGTYTRNWLRYNKDSSLFSCYGSGQADVCIYMLEGSAVEKTDDEKVTHEMNNLALLTDRLTETGEVELNTVGSKYDDVKIAWSVDTNAYATIVDGKLVISQMPASDTDLTLTATLTCGDAEAQTVTFNITLDVVSDSEKVKYESGKITAPEGTIKEDGDVTLDNTPDTFDDVIITWALKEASDYATISGNVLGVKRPDGEAVKVILVATFTKGQETATREFTVEVSAKAAAGTVENRTYDFSTITGSTQYADETHALDNDVTLKITDCHINSQLRIYSSKSNNGIAIIESTKVITKITVNVGYKADTLKVYGSTDGVTWVEVGSGITTTSNYADKTLDIPESAGYKYLKLDVAGTQQVRIKTMTLTLKG